MPKPPKPVWDMQSAGPFDTIVPLRWKRGTAAPTVSVAVETPAEDQVVQDGVPFTMQFDVTDPLGIVVAVRAVWQGAPLAGNATKNVGTGFFERVTTPLAGSLGARQVYGEALDADGNVVATSPVRNFTVGTALHALTTAYRDAINPLRTAASQAELSTLSITRIDNFVRRLANRDGETGSDLLPALLDARFYSADLNIGAGTSYRSLKLATGTAWATAPAWSAAGVTFAGGATSGIDWPALLTGLTAGSIIIVGRTVGAQGASGQELVSQYTPNVAGSVRMTRSSSGTVGGVTMQWVDATNALVFASRSAVAPANTSFAALGTFRADTDTVRIVGLNPSAAGNNSATDADLGTPVPAIAMRSGNSADGASPWNGRTAVELFFSRVLTDAEAAAVELIVRETVAVANFA